MKRFLHILFTTFLCFAWTTSGYAQTALSAEMRSAIEQVDALTAAEFGRDNVGGLTIGIISGPDLIWTKSYGHADMEKKTAAGKETIYRIGSITTQFTALMLLQLMQDGKVHLSDPVEKYFPEVNKIQGRFPNAAPITLVQLATHTAGLASEPDNSETYTKGAVASWEKVLIEALPHTKYVLEPGTRASYSNIGYAILGAALGRAAQQPYAEYVQQRILSPMGMTRTAFEPNPKIVADIAKGYSLEGGKMDWQTPEREHQGRGYKVPNGALYTTIGDLARFVSFELGEGPASVLTKQTLSDNFKRIVVMTDDYNVYLASGYGIGYRLRRQGEFIIFGHAGGVAGYEARADFDPVSGIGIVLLRNAGGKNVHVATSRLAGQALEKLANAKRGSVK